MTLPHIHPSVPTRGRRTFSPSQMGTPKPVQIQVESVGGEKTLGKSLARKLRLRKYFTSVDYLPQGDEVLKQE